MAGVVLSRDWNCGDKQECECVRDSSARWNMDRMDVTEFGRSVDGPLRYII